MEGQGRRTARTYGVVCRKSLQSPGRDRRRTPSQRLPRLSRRPEAYGVWDDKQTGAKHYRDLVYVDRIEFLDSQGIGNVRREPAETGSNETTVTDQDVPF